MAAQSNAPAPLHEPTPLPVTSELAVRLLPRAKELAVQLRDTMLAKDGVYASTDLIDPEDLLRSCEDNVLRSLQSLAGRVPDGVDPTDAARASASRRADAGFPLESILHAFRLGTEVLWAALLEEARTHAPHVLDDLLDSAAQVMELIDVMSVAVADEYRAREMVIHRRDAERRQAVLDSLLEGRGADPDVAAEAVRVLNLPERPRLVVVMVRHSTPSASPPVSPREALAAHGFRSEWRLRADREVGLVLIGAAPIERLIVHLRSVVQGYGAVSAVVVGLGEVVSAFRMAELALATVPKGAEPTFVTFEDRLPEALLAGSPLVASQLRACAFGGLLDIEAHKRQVLLDTLDSWFRNNHSASEVGAELHCHRNTVMHRLSRVEALSGRRLADSRDELVLRLALLTG